MAIEVLRIYEIQNIGKGEIIDIQRENLLELWDREAGELWRRGNGYNSLIPFYGPNQANAQSTIAVGEYTIADGFISFASGYQSQAIGDYSHAQGYNTRALGEASHAEGSGTTANGGSSHAEGSGSTANGYASHAEGYFTSSIGFAAHAEGYYTVAQGSGSHSEGYFNTADADYSHAGGNNSQAYGTASFVHGYDSIVNGNYSIVLGRDITGNADNTTYVDYFNIKRLGTGEIVSTIGIDANGNIVTGNLQKIISASTVLTSADNNYSFIINNGVNNITITIPAGLVAKLQICFVQQGTGNVTFVGSGGVSINTNIPGAFKIKGQHYNAYIEQVGNTNVYQLLGNLKV